MKHFIFCTLIVLAAFQLNAQQAIVDTSLCKAWHFKSTEQFGVITKATEQQKKDGLTLVKDGTAFYIVDGVTKTGQWSSDKARKNITLQLDTKEKLSFKILKLTRDELSYEYQSPELIRTKYNLSLNGAF